MNEKEDFASFIKENSRLAKEWAEMHAELYKLRAIRFIAKAAGRLIWTIVSLFLLFLFVIFIGITGGFWLSKLTGSYTTGFGIITLALALVLLLIAMLRQYLFINPLIRAMSEKAGEQSQK